MPRIAPSDGAQVLCTFAMPPVERRQGPTCEGGPGGDAPRVRFWLRVMEGWDLITVAREASYTRINMHSTDGQPEHRTTPSSVRHQ
eukprot:5134981-Pyramimonas_sp.AAC.1